MNEQIKKLTELNWENEERIIVERIVNKLKSCKSILVPKWVKEIISDIVFLISKLKEHKIENNVIEHS